MRKIGRECTASVRSQLIGNMACRLMLLACSMLAGAWLGNAAPTRAQSLSAGYLTVVTGGHFACAIRSDNTLACWGDSLYGQATPPSGSFSQISAGEFHACGIKTDGTAACWGFYGNVDTTSPRGSFTQVSAGYDVDCGIKNGDGRGFCWNARLGSAIAPVAHFTQISSGIDSICGISSTGTISCQGYAGVRVTPPKGTFTQISGAATNFCALKTDSTVSCWGFSDEGKAIAAPGGTFNQISVARAHACGLRAGGSATCWGYDKYGETRAPAAIFTSVSAGDDFSCGIRLDGTILCWGNNEFGQLNVPHNLPSAAIALANTFQGYKHNLVQVSITVHGHSQLETGFVVQSDSTHAYVLTAGALLRGIDAKQIGITVIRTGIRYTPAAVALTTGTHTNAMLAVLVIRAGGFHPIHWGNSYRLVQNPTLFAMYLATKATMQAQVAPVKVLTVGGDLHDSLGSFWTEYSGSAATTAPGTPTLTPDGSLMAITIKNDAGGRSIAAPSNWAKTIIGALIANAQQQA